MNSRVCGIKTGNRCSGVYFFFGQCNLASISRYTSRQKLIQTADKSLFKVMYVYGQTSFLFILPVIYFENRQKGSVMHKNTVTDKCKVGKQIHQTK